MYDAETVQLVPMFDAVTYSYKAEVLYGVTSLVVKYELRDTNAKNVTVRIGGAEASNLDNPGMVQDTTTSVGLSEGENTLTVEVTAEDGIANKAYEVIIDRGRRFERRDVGKPLIGSRNTGSRLLSPTVLD